METFWKDTTTTTLVQGLVVPGSRLPELMRDHASLQQPNRGNVKRDNGRTDSSAPHTDPVEFSLRLKLPEQRQAKGQPGSKGVLRKFIWPGRVISSESSGHGNTSGNFSNGWGRGGTGYL